MPIDKDKVRPTPIVIDIATTIISDKYKLDIFEKSELGAIIQRFLRNNKKL